MFSDSSLNGTSYFEKNDYILSGIPSKGQSRKVLIVSYFRSGSSWFGGLLSKTPKTFYLFEPLHLTEVPLSEGGDELYTTYKLSRLEELFQCGFSPRFMTHLRKFTSLYITSECPGKNCTASEITKRCHLSDFLTIKVSIYKD